jgi:rSAM/selenodomain-associated transferase 2
MTTAAPMWGDDAVAAVVPTLDEAARVGPLVDRLFALGCAEVWVVDGGSADATLARAAEAGARTLAAERGRGSQLDDGWRATSAPIVWFVHADAWPDSESVFAMRRALQRAAVVGGAFVLHTVEDRPRFGALVRIADLRSRYTRLPYGDQALFARRSALTAIGGVPRLPLFEDLVLARRLRGLGTLVTLAVPVRTSARRYTEAPVRTFCLQWLLPLLFRLGVSPETLAAWYGRSPTSREPTPAAAPPTRSS